QPVAFQGIPDTFLQGLLRGIVFRGRGNFRLRKILQGRVQRRRVLVSGVQILIRVGSSRVRWRIKLVRRLGVRFLRSELLRRGRRRLLRRRSLSGGGLLVGWNLIAGTGFRQASRLRTCASG